MPGKASGSDGDLLPVSSDKGKPVRSQLITKAVVTGLPPPTKPPKGWTCPEEHMLAEYMWSPLRKSEPGSCFFNRKGKRYRTWVWRRFRRD